MRLLERPLPKMSLHPKVEPSEFFDRCEGLASPLRARIDRRRSYAGPGFDHLNLWFREEPNQLYLRMVATPHEPSLVDCDIVSVDLRAPSYDEYVRAARAAFKPLLDAYSKSYQKLRLGAERKALTWNWDEKSVSCARLQYVHNKFHEAMRALAVGPEDSRGRLRTAFLILHVVRKDDLPLPLQPHFEWVVTQLTRREARWKGEGMLEATLARMTRATGATIAERIVEICEALDDLCPSNRL